MKTKILVALMAVAVFSGCTRVETGHVGIRTTFNGSIEPQELGVGYHQTLIGSMRTYVANEITQVLDDLHPQTKDRSTLSDLDLSYTYSVDPTAIADLVVKYKGRDGVSKDGDLYPLGLYVENVVRTATTDVFAQYDALAANENREKIRDEIKSQVTKIFKEEKLEGKVRVHQVFIKNLQIDRALMASAISVITAQNELKAKEYEVQTAKKEAERVTLLSNNKANLDYMNSKSMADIAEGVKSGKVHSIVVPYDFKGIINVGK
jgi:hypothetical protein